jgi:hypothetical protein
MKMGAVGIIPDKRKFKIHLKDKLVTIKLKRKVIGLGVSICLNQDIFTKFVSTVKKFLTFSKNSSKKFRNLN